MKPKIREPLEQSILRQILQSLKWRRDVLVWRQNTGAMKGRSAKGKSWYVEFAVKGCADILGLVSPEGWFLAIEVKRPSTRNQSTDHQVRFGEWIKEAGGIYFIACSAAEAMEQLDAELKRRRETKG